MIPVQHSESLCVIVASGMATTALTVLHGDGQVADDYEEMRAHHDVEPVGWRTKTLGHSSGGGSPCLAAER